MTSRQRTRRDHGPATEHPHIARCRSGELTGALRAAAIRALVTAQGKTLRSIAKEAGLNQQACSHALRYPWPRVERLIAEAVGTRPEYLWPERYEAGKPIFGNGTAWTKARREAGKAA